MSEFRDQVVDFVRDLQSRIVSALEAFEPQTKFEKVSWERPGGGGGDTRVISGGHIFEKGGVNVSVVHGQLPAKMQEKFKSKTADFFATGVSLVIHPRSPQIPTVHANFRYFEQADRTWFGGGADLTPYAPAPELFIHFHSCFQKACDFYAPDAYAKFKKECDEYFFLPHRGETRGIGGVFFDYLEGDRDKTFEFIKKSGETFIEAYIPIVEKTKDLKFSERQKKYQLLRRGRYVEFNLIYDRGTLFGLETKGNAESILMSLPPEVHFDFHAELETNNEERQLMGWLKKPVEWAGAQTTI